MKKAIIISILMVSVLTVKHAFSEVTKIYVGALQGGNKQMKAGELATSNLTTLLGYSNANIQSLTITQYEVLILMGANSVTKVVVGNTFTDDIRALFRQMKPGQKAIIQKVKARNGKLEARVQPVSITII